MTRGPNKTLARTGQGPASGFALTEGARLVQTLPRSLSGCGMLGVGNAGAGRLHPIAAPHEFLDVGIMGLAGVCLSPSLPGVVGADIVVAHLLLGFEAILDCVE